MSAPEKRIVVVTGGAGGIGRVICRTLAGPDTRIFFTRYNPADTAGVAAAETIRQVAEKGGSAVCIQTNVSEAASVADFFKAVLADSGRIDVLVNNAGVAKDNLLVRLKEADWDQVLAVNLKGAFLCTKHAGKAMMKQRAGRIINITSVSGVLGTAGQANYAAAKAGLIALTKSTARELAPRNVTANAVAPGYIETDMTAGLDAALRQSYMERIPLQRAGTGEDVANAVAFLASEAAAYITGQVLHVNGGMHM